MSFIPDTGPLSFNDIITYSQTGAPDSWGGGGGTSSTEVDAAATGFSATLPDNAWVFGKLNAFGPIPFQTTGNMLVRAPGATGTIYGVGDGNISIGGKPDDTISLDQIRGKGALYSLQNFDYQSVQVGGYIWRTKTSTVRQGTLANLLITPGPSGFACSLWNISIGTDTDTANKLKMSFAVWDSNNPTVAPSSSIYNSFVSTNLRSVPIFFSYLTGASSANVENLISYPTLSSTRDSSFYVPTGGETLLGTYTTTGSSWNSQVDPCTGSWSTNGLAGAPLNNFTATTSLTDTDGSVTGTVGTVYRSYQVKFGNTTTQFRGATTLSNTTPTGTSVSWRLLFLNDL